MLAEFVQKIISIAEPVIREEQDGRVYSDKALLPVQSPPVQPVALQTLAGFRDLHKLLDQSVKSIIHIEDYTSVWLMAKETDQWQRRAAFAHAKCPSEIRFKFGVWLEAEEFLIGMMTLFEDAEYGQDHHRVVKLVSSLAAEAVSISNDDGVSQQVITRQGLVTKSEEKVSPRVSLAPYRTFREISQPRSEFLLRLRSRSGQIPSCSLWEADGGEYKNTAMTSIRQYFERELPGADIVA